MTGIGDRQLFRMDAGMLQPEHGGGKHLPRPNGGELSVFNDPPNYQFHYHVRKFDGS